MKKSFILVLCALFVCFNSSAAAHAAEPIGWDISCSKNGNNTVLSFMATSLPADTTAVELGLKLPVGTVIKDITASYKNEDGTKPDTHITYETETTFVSAAAYCVNLISQPFTTNKVMFQITLSGNAINTSNTSISYVKTLNRSLEETLTTDGIQVKIHDSSSSGGDSNSGNSGGSSGSSTPAGFTSSVKNILVPESKLYTTVFSAEEKATEIKMEAIMTLDNNGIVSDTSITFFVNGVDSKNNTKLVLPSDKWMAMLEKLKKDYNLSDILPIQIILPKEKIAEQLASINSTNLTLTVPIPEWFSSHDWMTLKSVSLPKEALEAAKKQKKTLNLTFIDSAGKELYTWIFDSVALSKAKQTLTDVNLLAEISSVSEDQTVNKVLTSGRPSKAPSGGIFINGFGQTTLPLQVTLKIPNAKTYGIEAGKKNNLYQWNPKTNKLETVSNGFDYEIQKDGSIALNLVRNASYVLIPYQPSSKILTYLHTQITVPKTLTVYWDTNTDQKILTDTAKNLAYTMPASLEVTTSLKTKTSGSAYGAVTAAYQSSDSKVATVDKNGNITAVSNGTAVITTTVKLYTGKSKTFKTTVTVKKPSFTLNAASTELKVGEKTEIKVAFSGLKSDSSLIWKSSASQIAVVSSDGIVTAKSKGTVMITGSIGNISQNISITVE